MSHFCGRDNLEAHGFSAEPPLVGVVDAKNFPALLLHLVCLHYAVGDTTTALPLLLFDGQSLATLGDFDERHAFVARF